MNRLGFAPHAFRAAWTRLSGLAQVDEIALMTHFADADDAGAAAIARQLAAFERAAADLPGERSLCNSAALLRHAAERPEVRGDWVRPGIVLYGSSPDFPAHDIAHWELRTGDDAARAADRRAAARRAATPSATAAPSSPSAPMRIGIVACGYADGYPRHAPAGTPVLVDGVRTRLVGRVSMDMLAVDLAPRAAGRRRQRRHAVGPRRARWRRRPVLPIDEVAHAAGTIGYELMCALARRVPVRAA